MALIQWVGRLPASGAASAAALRTEDGLEAAVGDGQFWFRPLRACDVRPFRDRVPAAEWFEATPAGLRRLNERLPSETLPDLNWRPIAARLPVERPSVHAIAASPAAVRLQLTRDQTPQPSGGVLTSTQQLLAAIGRLPQSRLHPLHFAVSGDEAIVLGTPVLPVQGVHLVVTGRVAVAAGWRLSPDVAPDVVCDLLNAGDDFVLARPVNGVDRFERVGTLVPLTRASVRATLGAGASV